MFAVVMDRLIRSERSLHRLLFADDTVMLGESREQMEERLERWRYVLEMGRMKVNRSKT